MVGSGLDVVDFEEAAQSSPHCRSRLQSAVRDDDSWQPKAGNPMMEESSGTDLGGWVLLERGIASGQRVVLSTVINKWVKLCGREAKGHIVQCGSEKKAGGNRNGLKDDMHVAVNLLPLTIQTLPGPTTTCLAMYGHTKCDSIK